MEIRKYTFEEHGDERGELVAIEENRDIPFTIRRVYYMYDTDTAFTRGKHAHRNLEQILLCIHGSCKVTLDDGKERVTVEMNKPNEGLYISGCMWREMSDFSGDAVLMVLASELYDEADYIRDYDEFLACVNEQKEGK
ncbi:MAG: FdtA/QdtA family cupin domain-containing protein [Eubacterium sp.]|nr:FdtA/QdtA family cupin domain-containing protein [Eubacterium sp.]